MKSRFPLCRRAGVDDSATRGLRHIARIGSGSPCAELFSSCRKGRGERIWAVKVRPYRLRLSQPRDHEGYRIERERPKRGNGSGRANVGVAAKGEVATASVRRSAATAIYKDNSGREWLL